MEIANAIYLQTILDDFDMAIFMMMNNSSFCLK